jgi:uncharacterized protein DUF4265
MGCASDVVATRMVHPDSTSLGFNTMIDEQNIAAHESPIGRSEANFVIHVDLRSSGMPGRWEQLWARQLDGNRFRLCCIPFFAYGVAFGDEVTTKPTSESDYVMENVVRPSDRTAVRVAVLAEAGREDLARRLVEGVRSSGCVHEWYSERYLAIDCKSESTQLALLISVLKPLEAEGLIEFETSR